MSMAFFALFNLRNVRKSGLIFHGSQIDPDRDKVFQFSNSNFTKEFPRAITSPANDFKFGAA